MAFGTWLAGAIHDRMGFYAAAWWVGIVVNLVQLALVGWLLSRQFLPRGLRHA
jgi:cyanate permease